MAGGIGGAGVAALRPELIPVGAGVSAEAVSGAGLALGVGVTVVGLLHLAVAMTAGKSRRASAAGAVGAASLSVALLTGMLSALVATAVPLIPALGLGCVAYGWIALVLGAPDRRSGLDGGS